MAVNAMRLMDGRSAAPTVRSSEKGGGPRASDSSEMVRGRAIDEDAGIHHRHFQQQLQRGPTRPGPSLMLMLVLAGGGPRSRSSQDARGAALPVLVVFRTTIQWIYQIFCRVLTHSRSMPVS